MLFSEIPGQTRVKQALIQAVQNGRIPHAQLFAGPSGSGQLALALAYIQFLFCENRGAEDACNTCRSCKQVSQLQHPDIHYSYPVAKTDKSSDKPLSEDVLPAWREFVSQQVYGSYFDWLKTLGIQNKQAQISVYESQRILQKLSLKAYSGSYRVQLIWMAEKMHPSAANKLLKSIEEPEPGTLFVLVAQHPEQILGTILSRTQLVQLPPYTRREISEAIQERFPEQARMASLIALSADGDLGRAWELARGDSEHNNYALWFVEWMRMCYKANLPELILWTDKISGLVREQLKDFLTFCISALREAWMENYRKSQDVHPSFRDTNFSFSDFAPFVPDENIASMREELDKAIYEIERNLNPKFVLMDVSIRFARSIRAVRSKKAGASG